MVKKYFFNFWIWWYGVQLVYVFQTIYSFWSMSLANMNILPMMSNLFVPMYQDQSFTGKMISFVVRLLWVVFGGLLQFLITIPLLLILLIWILLPFLCIIQIFRFLL